MSLNQMDCLLHDHADGARPVRRKLRWLYEKNGKPIPKDINLEEMILAKFLDPHSDIVEAFSHTTGLMQGEETIRESTKNHVLYRAEEHIRYDEFMIAPQYHLFGEFSKEAETDPVRAMTRVINAAVEGIKDAERERPEIEANLIAAIGRELSPEKAIEVLKAIERSDRNYVVGTNIVCDESAFPPELHQKTFEYADAAGINFEFHAGEWVRGPEQEPNFQRDLPSLIKNIRVVMDMYRKSKSGTKKRIGHGIALPYDLELMKIARDYEIGVTGCPHSNLFGNNVPDLTSLKIRDMLLFRILWSMNPDDDFFHACMKDVFKMCDVAYEFTENEKILMRLNAWQTRFGSRKPVPEDVVGCF